MGFIEVPYTTGSGFGRKPDKHGCFLLYPFCFLHERFPPLKRDAVLGTKPLIDVVHAGNDGKIVPDEPLRPAPDVQGLRAVERPA